MAFFKVLEPNTRSRDFVVGDIHGTYSLLELAMRIVKFDKCVDRLISVGDLMDRGEESVRCLEFLREPWFHAIRGNHEDIILDIFKNGNLDPAKYARNIRNGVAWLSDVPKDIMGEIVGRIGQLPIAMQVETQRGSVGFVHAEVPVGLNWQEFVQEIKNDNDQVIQTALWGRDRITHMIDTGVEGIGRVFAGHTIMGGAARLGNVYAIDTGAYLTALHPEIGGTITFMDIMGATQSLDRAAYTAPIDIIADRPENLRKPFGNYAKSFPDGAKPK